MIENGFVYAIDKSIEKRKKLDIKRQIKSDKFHEICRKYNKSLDELDKNELTKTEYKFILEYVEKILKYPIRFYSNLQ